MSSLRNAVKRVTHKERGQLQKRQHLGILEKKKDYKERAVNYHKRQDFMKLMKEKASMRNPDEFYFGMNKTQVKKGQHKSVDEDQQRNLPPELIDLMKSQDLRYIRMQKQKDAKKAERLQSSLQLLGETDEDGTKSSKKRKHTVFVDDPKEAENFDVAKHFGTVPELAGRSFNRLRTADIERLAQAKSVKVDQNDEYAEEQPKTSEELADQAKKERKLARKLARARSSAYGELEARKQRAKAMQRAEDHLVTEKMVASKGRKRKIKPAEDGRPAQYKWRRKRLT